jgi:hypothetical protein
MLRRLVNDELKSICIEVVVAYFELVCMTLPGVTEDPQEPESQ